MMDGGSEGGTKEGERRVEEEEGNPSRRHAH